MKKLFFLPLLLWAVVLPAQSVFGEGSSLNLTAEGAVIKAEWEAEAHDFGKIAQGEPVTHTFYVKNTGNQPLLITRVKPSCGCTAADYTQEPIEPGEKGYLTATYNAAATGFFSKTIVVTTNVEDTPTTLLRFTGEVLPKEGN